MRISEWFCSAYCSKYIYSRKKIAVNIEWYESEEKAFISSLLTSVQYLVHNSFQNEFHGFGQVTEIVILESTGNGVDTKSELCCYHNCNC